MGISKCFPTNFEKRHNKYKIENNVKNYPKRKRTRQQQQHETAGNTTTTNNSNSNKPPPDQLKLSEGTPLGSVKCRTSERHNHYETQKATN